MSACGALLLLDVLGGMRVQRTDSVHLKVRMLLLCWIRGMVSQGREARMEVLEAMVGWLDREGVGDLLVRPCSSCSELALR